MSRPKEKPLLTDARQVERSSTACAPVAIVGGGPAGLALALALEQQGVACIVLESGALNPDAKTLRLYEGHAVGLPYGLSKGYRNRYLGGNSNCWGGFCRPWDDWEFKHRPWVDGSGWPIDGRDLAPHYRRAGELLRLGDDCYDAQRWIDLIDRPDVRRFDLPPDAFHDGVSLLSPPVRFGTDYRDHLAKSRQITLYLRANVVEIESDPSASHIRSLRVRTLSGNEFRVRAEHFVLAAGGIENARLLLASNQVASQGLGNAHDLVGRYFSDHPRVRWGRLKMSPEQRNNRFYDITFNWLTGTIGNQTARASAFMSLPFEVQREEGLVNAHIWLRSMFLGEESALRTSLARMKQRLLSGQRYGYGLVTDAVEMMRHPISTAAFMASYAARTPSLMREVCLEGIVEAAPNRDSRVTLSGEKDALGMPRVRVDWRLAPLTAHTLDRTFARMSDVLERAGIATIERGPSIEKEGWPDWMESTWHPMGTTRMHDSPRQGVVDRNCRVHGLSNLFVAGSSVFTTTAANHPTMTLVALSLRLADHLAASLENGAELSLADDHAHL